MKERGSRSYLPLDKEFVVRGVYPESDLVFMEQAAQLLEMDLEVISQPGQKYTNNFGITYRLNSESVAVTIKAPSDSKDFSDFWATLQQLKEASKQV